MTDPAPTDAHEPRPQPIRRRGVGPFSLRQVTIAILAMMGAAIVGTLATRPLGSIPIGLPVPDPSAYLIGSPIPGLRAWLAKKGYDPKMGARPLGRVIQREVRDPLTDEILFGKLENGGTVTIGVTGETLTFAYE
jgi:hypothetical protein